MSHNTDNPAFPIIEFLKQEIKIAEERKEYFLSKQMPDSYKMANYFKIAYEHVLKFIEETFEDEAPTEPEPYYMAWQKCPVCNGTGKNYGGLQTSAICSTCNGQKIIHELTGLPPAYTAITSSGVTPGNSPIEEDNSKQFLGFF